jgi:ParB family chromosome partitioning protein
MSINPFSEDELDDFYGVSVRVTHEKQEYTGWVRRIYGDMETIVLQDGRGPDGEKISKMTIRHPERVERLDPAPSIQSVPLEEIRFSPYDCHEGSKLDTEALERTIRRRGHLVDYPTVRTVEAGYEVVDGHGRVRAARDAALESIAVELVELSDWEAAKRFVDEHIHLRNPDREVDESRWYSDEQVDAAIDKLRERWKEARLREIPALAQRLE